MKKNVIKVISLLGFTATPMLLHAEHVLPVFSGSWYTEAVYQSTDSCGNNSFSYVNKLEGSAEFAAQQLLNNVTPRSDCTWQPAFLYQEQINKPYDFVGNDTDWQTLRNDKTKSHVMVWRRICQDSHNRILETKSITLQPAYVCPVGSKQGVNQVPNHLSVGCTTTPAPCQADVAGRNLNVIGFGELGHIGLVDPGFSTNQVVEVLNTPKEGIFFNQLEDFKKVKDSPYWGIKSGLAERPTLTSLEGFNIINAARDQSFYPFEYTLTWDWHPGGMVTQAVFNQDTSSWEKTLATQGAKFRCDSFVYYSYLKGANLHIVPQFSIPVVPKTMFDSFLNCQDKQGSVCASSVSTASHYFSNTSQRMALASSFESNDINIQQTDKIMKEYLDNPGISRSDKLTYLWGLVKTHEGNDNQYRYLLDSLSYLKPIELIPELIDEFKHQAQSDKMRKIAAVMFAALQNDVTNLNNQIKNVMLAQNFARDLLLKNQDPEVVKYVASMYSSITSPNRAKLDMESFFNRSDIKLQDIFSENEWALLKLRIAFANPETQSQVLSQLMESQPNNITFKNAFCFMLNTVPSQWIAEDSKVTAERFLVENKSVLATNVSEANFNQNCDWLNAYATVMVRNENNKDEFMLNYIRQEKNSIMQAGFISHLNAKQFSMVSASDRNQYRSKLQGLLLDKSVSQKEEKVIKSAMIRLQK